MASPAVLNDVYQGTIPTVDVQAAIPTVDVQADNEYSVTDECLATEYNTGRQSKPTVAFMKTMCSLISMSQKLVCLFGRDAL